MQNFTPIGATVAEIFVTGKRKNSNQYTLPWRMAGKNVAHRLLLGRGKQKYKTSTDNEHDILFSTYKGWQCHAIVGWQEMKTIRCSIRPITVAIFIGWSKSWPRSLSLILRTCSLCETFLYYYWFDAIKTNKQIVSRFRLTLTSTYKTNKLQRMSLKLCNTLHSKLLFEHAFDVSQVNKTVGLRRTIHLSVPYTGFWLESRKSQSSKLVACNRGLKVKG